MIRTVLDTNIFVSSVFWREGNPHKVVQLALDKKIHVFTSLQILQELERVLRRDFEEPEEIVQRQISLVLEYANVIKPSVTIDAIKEDPDDNKILECAVSCGADYIVTGDSHLLKLKAYGKTKIVTARQFLQLF